MPDHRGQDDLSTPPDDAADIEVIILDLIEDQRRDEESFAALNRLVADEITEDLGDLELKEYHSEDLERAQNAVVQNAAEGIADPDSAAVVEELAKQLAAATAKLPASSLAARTYNLQRFLGVFAVGAFGTAVASLFYTAIHAALHDQPAPAPLPPDTAAKVRELVRQWNAETDQNYWKDLANYVERAAAKEPLTLADQVLFMNYTVDLSPAGDAWLWDTGQDLVDLVAKLVTAYHSAGATPAMYRLATTLTYHGRPIPRPVTAGLLRHALGQIVVLGSGPRATVFAVPGEPGRGEDRLSEPPDDEHKSVEEEAAAARAEEDGFAARVQEITAEIAKDVAGIEASTLNCDSVEAAWAEPVSVASSAIAAPEPSPRLDALQQRLDRVTAGAGRSPEASKEYSVARFAAAFFGLAVLGSAAVVLLEYLTRVANDQPTDDITSIPAETLDKLHGLVKEWKAQSDKVYWESVATYAEQHPGAFTIPDQIVFTNYTIQLSPPAEAFLWDTAKDKADVADQLLDAAKSGADLPGMYRGVAALRYAGTPLPRAVAADVVRLALGWLAAAPSPDTRFPSELPSDGIPERLRPVPYVLDVAAGTHPDAYARLLHSLLRPAGVRDHAEVTAAAVYQQPTDTPFILADAAATLSRLPASAQETVRAQMAQLTGVLDATYPVPAGEAVSGTELSYLAQPGGGLAAGTIVYVRRTSAATVYFALPHLAVDPATGTPRLVGLDGPVVPPPRPVPPATRFSLDPASAALSVAGNLVWAMPPPWGPIAAGGITLIQLLLADGGKQDQFTAAVQQLEQFIKHRDVNADATHIRGFADWMDSQFQTLQVTQADNAAYITATLLPELRRMVAPGDDSVYDAIYDLERNLDVDGTLQVLVLGVTIYLLALKMIVQLDAQLATTSRAAGDDAGFAAYTDLWLADYANLVIAIDGYTTSTGSVAGWASRVSGHVDAAITGRLANVIFPYRYDNRHWAVNTGGGSTGTSGYWVSELGWTYRDDGRGDTDTTNFVADAQTGGDCCHAGTTIEYEQLVHQYRDERAQAVAAAQDLVYGDIRQTIRKWQAAVLEWNQHLPPRRPTSAPTISGFTGTGPAGNWVDGSSVGYAVAFANQASGPGPGQIGPWSVFKAVGTHAGATLTDLPVDPLKMATHLWIYRRFRPADGTTSPLRLVGITDTKAASYTDTKP